MKTRLLLTLTALLLALSSWADGTEIDGIYYNLYSSTKTASVTITGSTSDLGNSYTGSVTIPSIVTYGSTTYSVTSIEGYAFYKCTGLTSITIPNSVTSIGWDAFEYCSGLTSITIGNSVTSIGNFAFFRCTGLTSITIPNSVTTIGDAAFAYCSGLTSISIPSSVTSIGYGAFAGCTGLTSVKVEAGNKKYDSRDNCNAIIKTASNTLVAGCKTTTIPSSVTSIEYYVFEGCTSLTSITIPSSVTSIGGWTFAYCTGLTSITIPESVTSIGTEAFTGCTGLTSITACKMEPSEYNCSTSAFDDIPYSSVTLYVPAGSASAYKVLAPWSNFSNIVETDLTSIQTPTINSSETIVGYYNLQGQRIATPQRGQLVIVRYSDGTSRKMLVQ